MKENGHFGDLVGKFVRGAACALPTNQFCPTGRLCEPTNLSVDAGKLPKSDEKFLRERVILSGHGIPVRY